MTDEELQEMIDEAYRDGDGEVNPHHEEDQSLLRMPGIVNVDSNANVECLELSVCL